MSRSSGFSLAIGVCAIAAIVVLSSHRKSELPDAGRDRDRVSSSAARESGKPLHSAMDPQWPQDTQPNGSAPIAEHHNVGALLSDPVAASTEPASITAATEAMQSAADPLQRTMAIYELRGVAGRSVSAELGQSLSDPDPEVRATALEELALDRIDWSEDDDDEELLSARLSGTQDPSPTVRMTALRLANEADSDRGLALVQQGLHDSDEQVRDWAALLLASADDAGESTAER